MELRYTNKTKTVVDIDQSWFIVFDSPAGDIIDFEGPANTMETASARRIYTVAYKNKYGVKQ